MPTVLAGGELAGTGGVSLQPRQALFQLEHPLLECLDRLSLGIWEAMDRSGIWEPHGHDAAGHTDDRRVRRHVVDDDGASADPRALADLDRSDQLGVRADDDAIA